jgi:hypothetical protein
MGMRPEASMCAWCGFDLGQRHTARVVKAETVGALPEYEGAFVSLKLAKSGRTIVGLFLTSDSPAKREGVDVVFATCSQECALALKAAIQEEVDNLRLVTG